MTRLTDAELAELEHLWRVASKDEQHADAFVDELVNRWPAILAELRALRKVRKVREAAERYHEASKAYQDLMDGTSNELKLAMSRQDARIALFAALDEARGEQ